MNMNSSQSDGRRSAAPDREAAFAQRVLARLDGDSLTGLNPDIAERLRFARQRAVQRARQVGLVTATGTPLLRPAWAGSFAGAGAPVGSSSNPSPAWMAKLTSFVELAIVVMGLLVIQQHLSEDQISAAAELDVVLLSDDLPPAAYSDPGFAEFTRRSGN